MDFQVGEKAFGDMDWFHSSRSALGFQKRMKQYHIYRYISPGFTFKGRPKNYDRLSEGSLGTGGGDGNPRNCLSVYLSIYLSAIYPSIHLSIYPSIHQSINRSIYQSVNLSICLFVYLSICLSVCLSAFYGSDHPNTYPIHCGDLAFRKQKVVKNSAVFCIHNKQQKE